MEEECVEETYYEEEQDHGDDGIPYPYPSPYCVYLSVLNSVLLVCDAYYYVMCWILFRYRLARLFLAFLYF